MNKLGYILAISATVAITNVVLGGEIETNEVLRVVLDLSDGSRLVGTPGVESVPVSTPYANMSVPLRKIRVITMQADHESASFELENGDKITGVITLGPVNLGTMFGQVSIPIENIRTLRVSPSGGAFARRGLVLWNRLDSEYEVTRSAVGPGGMFNAGRFVEGRFGKAIELNMQEQFGVTFPPEIVPGPDGCIEFWAKLVNFPKDMRQQGGSWPGLIAACSQNDSQDFLLCFCANDGASNGGICARVAGLGSAGTGHFGDWTYARALNSNEVNDWHHYGFVWATNGIPGVDNGARKTAVYVDGKLNTGFWGGGTGDKLTVPTNGRFGLLSHQGTQTGSVVFDNLKIWSYAKTDFSDLNEETP